jgi:hypothetical protein
MFSLAPLSRFRILCSLLGPLLSFHATQSYFSGWFRQHVKFMTCCVQWKTGCKSFSGRVARWFLFRPKIQFGQILEGLRWKNVGIFNGDLEYITNIRDVLWPFGTFCVQLVHFFRFWYHVPKKILATLILGRWLRWKQQTGENDELWRVLSTI